MPVHNQSPTLGSENPKRQSKTTLNISNANLCNLSVMYTNADNLINKRSELLTVISADNPDIICITKTPPKHTYLPINKCKLLVYDYECFWNTNESNYHRGVVIYVKKYLNATSFRINQNRLNECNCCKIVLNVNTILYINCEIPSYILIVFKQYN